MIDTNTIVGTEPRDKLVRELQATASTAGVVRDLGANLTTEQRRAIGAIVAVIGKVQAAFDGGPAK
jgi:rRNA processing protein Gar1